MKISTKISRLIFMISLVGSVVGAADKPRMRSEPEHGYLDPDEIGQVVLDDFRNITIWKLSNLEHPNKEDIRLVDGNVPIFDIDGNIVGYYVIAIVLPGRVPTVDEIYAQAISAYPQLVTAFKEEQYWNNPAKAYDLCFPYYNGCWSAEVWVGDYGHIYGSTEQSHLPDAIFGLGRANKAAVAYFGNSNVDFLGFVAIRTENAGLAYEFTNGNECILMPFDEDGNMFNIVTRTEAEIKADRRAFPPLDSNSRNIWAQEWVRRIGSIDQVK